MTLLPAFVLIGCILIVGFVMTAFILAGEAEQKQKEHKSYKGYTK